MKIWRLAKANLVKKIESTITLSVFILMAALMLNLGVIQLISVDQFYEKKENQLQSPHFYAAISKNQYKLEYEEYLYKDKRFEKAEVETVVYMSSSKNNRNKFEFPAFIFNKDTQRKIAPFKLVKEDKSVPLDKAIYMPLIMEGYNLKLGSLIDYVYKGKVYSFQVAGFFETTYLGIANCGGFKYYVSNEVFEKIYPQIGGSYFLSGRFKEQETDMKKSLSDTSEEFLKDFGESTGFFDANEGLLSVVNFGSKFTMKSQIISMIGIPAFIFIAIALVVTLVFMVIIFFKVLEKIDDNMKEFGALQALGYKSSQIMSFLILEFFIIAIIGTILGTFGSYLISFLLKNTFQVSSGLVWEPHVDFTANIICGITIMSLVLLSSFVGSFSLKGLSPVIMLRKGLQGHVYFKNFLPLNKGFGDIHCRLAFKNIFNNIKQNLILLFIICLSTFVIGVSIVLLFNFALDNKALKEITGIEISDLQVITTLEADIDELEEELQHTSGIRKTLQSDMISVKIEENRVSCIVSDSFEKMETLKVYKGYFPKYKDEIVLSIALANKINKDIGDSISVSLYNRTSDYTVVGFTQTTNSNGMMVLINEAGVKVSNPNYKMSQIDIYLDKGTKSEEMIFYLEKTYKVFIDTTDSKKGSTKEEFINKYEKAVKTAEMKISKLLSDYGVRSVAYSVMLDGEIVMSGNSNQHKIRNITNINGFLKGQLELYVSILFALVVIITAINFTVISGALFLCIGSILRRNRTEYGIFKALGYSTKELVKQLFLNFIVVSSIGTVMGIFLTISLSNHILLAFFRVMGVLEVNLVINPYVMVLTGLAIVILISVVALIKILKIKHISPYELITE